MKKILVAAVHPDDETIGCGGAILKHINSGDDVYWLIITNVSEDFGWTEEKIDKRQKEIKSVAEMYQFKKTFKLDFPSTKLDEIPMGQLVKSISQVINEVQPDIIYVQNRTDVHTDHKTAFQALYSCTKSFRYPFIKRILMYETLSETEFAPSTAENVFIPNVFIDISDYIERKLEIMQIYESEVQQKNSPRSLSAMKALAQYRGSRIICDFAEAFQLIFERD